MEMIEVRVSLPADRHAEFHQMFGHWLASPADGDASELTEWGPNDLDRAKQVWTQLSPKAKEIAGLLIDSKGPIPAAELAQKLGFANEFGVAGTLAWPGRFCYAVGRKLFIRWEETKEGSIYSIEPHVATLFQQARDELE